MIELQEVQEKTTVALRAAEADAGASPVLVAVGLADGGRRWDAVVELEQAGDSAKAAAEADGGAGEATTSSVLAAHLAICMLKAAMAQTVS